MVGMIQIVVYLLCIYLIFKAADMYQLSFAVTDPERAKTARAVGMAAILTAVIVAIVFIYWINSQAEAIGKGMQNLMPR
jgi:NADH:ubiquinone oxidoreductase subunit 6 (subunit J)